MWPDVCGIFCLSISEGIDIQLNHKMAFDQIKTILMDRLNELFNHEKFAREMQKASSP